MTKLIFITHPDTKQDPNVPITDWEYSNVGKTDVQQLLDKSFWTEVNAIYSSSEKKCWNVAQLVSEKCAKKLKIEKDLREIGRSSTGYLPRDIYMSAMQEFYNSPSVGYKGWESAQDAGKRIVACVSKIMDNHKDKTVAIVSHGAVGTLLLCYLKNTEPSMDQDPEGTAFIFEAMWDRRRVIKDWYKY